MKIEELWELNDLQCVKHLEQPDTSKFKSAQMK